MNNHSHKTCRRLVLGALLTWAAAPSFAVTEIHGDAGSAVVSLGDLDLASARGRTEAQERVEHTARRLCGKLASATDWSRHANYLACVDDAVSSAMQKLGQAGTDLRLPQ